MSSTEEIALKEALMKEIEKDEYEYTHDPSYCPADQWEKSYGRLKRNEGYEEAISYYKNLTVKEIVDEFGDKYNYIIEQYQ